MKKIIFLTMFILLINLAYAQNIYMEVCLDITENSMESSCIELYEGQPKDYIILEFDEHYTAKIFSFKEDLLKEFKFEKDFTLFIDGENESGAITLPEVNNRISFPYYSNAKRLEVWDGRKIMLNLDLSEYATCNQDNICDINENRQCEDCINKPKPEAIETIEESGITQTKTKKTNYLYLIIPIIILITILILILRKRKLYK